MTLPKSTPKVAAGISSVSHQPGGLGYPVRLASSNQQALCRGCRLGHLRARVRRDFCRHRPVVREIWPSDLAPHATPYGSILTGFVVRNTKSDATTHIATRTSQTSSPPNVLSPPDVPASREAYPVQLHVIAQAPNANSAAPRLTTTTTRCGKLRPFAGQQSSMERHGSVSTRIP